MRIKKGEKSKKSNETSYWTPDELYDFLTKKYRFQPNCDIAATKANSICDYYYDKGMNALRIIKWRLPRRLRRRIICWCNPPNNNMGKFIYKVYEQYNKFGIRTMMIMPTNIMGTKAWWKCVEDPIDRGEKIFFKAIYRRPQFKLRGKNSEHSSINSYLVVIFGRKKR